MLSSKVLKEKFKKQSFRGSVNILVYVQTGSKMSDFKKGKILIEISAPNLNSSAQAAPMAYEEEQNEES